MSTFVTYQAPQQWEYKLLRFSNRDTKSSQTPEEADAGTRKANALGQEGWRLCGAPTVSGNTVYFWFERPIA